MAPRARAVSFGALTRHRKRLQKEEISQLRREGLCSKQKKDRRRIDRGGQAYKQIRKFLGSFRYRKFFVGQNRKFSWLIRKSANFNKKPHQSVSK
jgi:hypothetical protein